MGSSSTKSLLSVSEVIDKVAEPKAKNPIGHPKKEVERLPFFVHYAERTPLHFKRDLLHF